MRLLNTPALNQNFMVDTPKIRFKSFSLAGKDNKNYNNLEKTQQSIINALQKNVITGSSSELSASYKEKSSGFYVKVMQLNEFGNHFQFYDAKNLKVAEIDVFSNGQIKITKLFGSCSMKGYLNFDKGLKRARIFSDDKSSPVDLFK